MTDIVKRLRNPARGGGGDAYEAADEIERLRAVLRAILVTDDDGCPIYSEHDMRNFARAALGETKP